MATDMFHPAGREPSGVELQVRRRKSRATTMFFPQSSAMLIRDSRISSEG